jgi:nitrous oxidase accessory protein NosD
VLVEVDGNGDAQGCTFEGNHWAAYAGYDLNHDGTGDVAFLVREPSSDLGDVHPALKFFQGTAAMGLYDAIAQAMPFFGSKLLLTDPHPAMRPHQEIPR